MRMMTLQDYLSANGINQADFAKRIGVSRPYVCLLALGTKTPSLEVALSIQEVTGGEVSVNQWKRNESPIRNQSQEESLKNQQEQTNDLV